MKKNTFSGLLTVAGFLLSFCFSQSAICASEVKLNDKTKAEIVGMFSLMDNSLNSSFTEFTNEDMVHFGIVNSGFKPKKLFADESYMMSAKIVDETVKKYFNRKVKHGSTQYYKYQKGFYKIPANDSGGDLDVVKITKIEKIDDENIMVHATTYDPTGSKFIRKEKATFTRVTDGGKTRYVYRTYQIIK